MIENNRGQITWFCDVCGQAEFESEPDAAFKEAWGAAKSKGWKSKTIKGLWVHACPDCTLEGG